MGAQVGDRVVAIRSADSKRVLTFGEGVYQGRVYCEALGYENPCILLDMGMRVWGYQCWWGPVDQMKERFKHHEEFVVEPDAE